MLDQKRLVEKLVHQVKRFKKNQKWYDAEGSSIGPDGFTKKTEPTVAPIPPEKKALLNSDMWHTRKKLLEEWFSVKKEVPISHLVLDLIGETIESTKREQSLFETQLSRIKINQHEISIYQELTQELDEKIKNGWEVILPLDEEMYSGKSWSQLFLSEGICLLQQALALPDQMNSRLNIAHEKEKDGVKRFDVLKKNIEYLQRKRLSFYLKALFWFLVGSYSLCLLYT
ncbi:hypothetical protein BY458DRAFT_573877 [Sporodiniella umbellata]|nr:hypothetical protein BY458DRAFT_573877 [Sporodiniella umbellata]